MRKSTLNAPESSTQEPEEELRIDSEYIIDGFYRYNRLKVKKPSKEGFFGK